MHDDSGDHATGAPLELAPPSSLGTAAHLRALLQLVRLPNVFTALADIWLGYLFTHAALSPWPIVALLSGSSALIYAAGMALNDYFDRSQDAHERPARPIPSGRVSATGALRLGLGMLVTGVLLAGVTSSLTGGPRPAVIATALAAMVLIYDGWLKPTPLAPLAMGSCRLLNVLLGMMPRRAIGNRSIIWWPREWDCISWA